jgi:HK97 family phage major capsid protein
MNELEEKLTQSLVESSKFILEMKGRFVEVNREIAKLKGRGGFRDPGDLRTDTEELSHGNAPLVFRDAEGKEYKALRPGEPLFTREGAEDFSVGKILRARVLGKTAGLNDFETKAAGEGVGSAGGWMVHESVSARIIDLARNLSCVQKAGASTIPMDTPEMRLVKITGDPTAYWVAEHGEITESDWTLEPINLKAMTVGCLIRASLEILEDAPNSGAALQAAMAAAIALEIDRVALLGDGVNEPRGLDLCAGVNLISMGVNGGALTSYDVFSQAVEDVADYNGEANAVIFSPRTYFTLDRLKAATINQPLIPPQSFIDLKKFKTNQIGVVDVQGSATTASKAFVGDFSQILFGIRKPLEVEFTRQGGTGTFAKCETLIRCRMRLDVAVLRENHFTRIVGIL